MLFICIFIALAFFFYFQQRASNRNMERFQKSRDRFDQLIERLKKNDGQDTDGNEKTPINKT